jgi:sec-independent protein translocase protein TatA
LLIKILLVVFIVLLLFGASRLPSLARSFGQSIGEFKKGLKELEEHPDDKTNSQT